jgi:dihydrofolate reductase
VAIAGKKAAIGKEGKLLLAISDDLKRFKRLTLGHPIILGRKTYQSIGRILPNRTNIIVTRNKGFQVPGAIICHSLPEAIEKADDIEEKRSLDSSFSSSSPSHNSSKEIFIIGGGEIYKEGLPLTDKLYITLIDKELEGDTFFPDYSQFKKILYKEDRVDEKTGITYQWIDLEL